MFIYNYDTGQQSRLKYISFVKLSDAFLLQVLRFWLLQIGGLSKIKLMIPVGTPVS